MCSSFWQYLAVLYLGRGERRISQEGDGDIENFPEGGPVSLHEVTSYMQAVVLTRFGRASSPGALLEKKMELSKSW